MKKILRSSLFIASVLFLFTSCKKEGAKEIVITNSFPDNALTTSAPSNTIVLTEANDDAISLSFSWLPSDYGSSTLLGTYVLQLDVAADAWASPLEFSFSRDSLTKGINGKALNDFLTTKGFVAGIPGTFLARVKSDITQYNGAASTIPSIYSNTLTITAITHVTVIAPTNGYLYVVGGYQGWDPSSAPKINEAAGHPKKYEGFINFPASSADLYFKYTSDPDWDHTNYGNSNINGIFTIYNGSVNPDPPAMALPSPGYYYLTADIDPAAKAWTATKTTWAIIGDATPGGWDTDTQMSYDVTSKTWSVIAVMKATGSFKFRANNDWKLDFGIAVGAPVGKLAWSDNTLLGYDASINSITVPEDGTYTITLDLHNSGNYTYTAVKI